MILITRLDKLELKLAFFDSKYRIDGNLYFRFVNLYENNFRIWLDSIGKLEVFLEGEKNLRPYQESPNIIQIRKWTAEFDLVRPYYYIHENKYYFYRSHCGSFLEASIFELEAHEIIQILEKSFSFSDGNLVDRLKRRFNKIKFVTDLDRSQISDKQIRPVWLP